MWRSYSTNDPDCYIALDVAHHQKQRRRTRSLPYLEEGTRSRLRRGRRHRLPFVAHANAIARNAQIVQSLANLQDVSPTTPSITLFPPDGSWETATPAVHSIILLLCSQIPPSTLHSSPARHYYQPTPMNFSYHCLYLTPFLSPSCHILQRESKSHVFQCIMPSCI